MSAQLVPRRFNVIEYYRMATAGVLTPDDRVELIDGRIIKMSPIGSPHAACVARLSDALHHLAKPRALVWIQSPIRLNEFSEPVPDVAFIKARKDYYDARHPKPDDVWLIIEVAATSLLTDRNIKVPLYARAGIVEVWLVNLPKEMVEVYSAPVNGKYSECEKFKRGAVVKSPTVKGLSLKVNEILG